MTNPVDKNITFASMRRDRVRDAMPTHYISDYPQLVQLLHSYYEQLSEDEGFSNLIDDIRNARNPDAIDPDLIACLKNEYGGEFPNFATMDEATQIKIFIYWYRSKGNKEAVEAYFRLFLNSEAEVTYPKDNMLRCSDGVWDAGEGDWDSSRGKLSETTMVIQDSYYYQTHSYLIKSGISIVDWGNIYKKLAHPAGWEFFGEVELKGYADFEYNTASPTIIPGIQDLDLPYLIIAAWAAFASGATIQQVVKTWDVLVSTWTGTRNLRDVAINFCGSNYPMSAFGTKTIQEIMTSVELTSIREPATIIIT